MSLLRGIVQIGPVWLTAVMTLIAGLPHCQCRCPDGSLKLFCLRSPLQDTACCCGGACCSVLAPAGRGAAVPAKPAKCCGHCQLAAKTPAPGGQVKGTCCQKTVALGQPVILVTAKRMAGEDPTAGLLAPTPDSLLPLVAPPGGSCRLTWDNYRLPPPTDLVIALQHFLI
jgi:hypothetical protein